MAENYVLSCCSTADLTDEQFEARSIHYICFHFELGGKSYMDDLGKSIPFDEFYKRMEQGEDTKTSQINAEEFEQYFVLPEIFSPKNIQTAKSILLIHWLPPLDMDY